MMEKIVHVSEARKLRRFFVFFLLPRSFLPLSEYRDTPTRVLRLVPLSLSLLPLIYPPRLSIIRESEHYGDPT